MNKGKFIAFAASFLILCGGVVPLPVCAAEESEIISVEYFEDGSFVETVLYEDAEETVTAARSTASTKTGKKTTKYKLSDGTVAWSVTVHGTFTYTGSSAKCTKATVSTTSPDSYWSIASSSAKKSGASASATATAKKKVDGEVKQTMSRTVKLTCSAKGKLS